MSLFAKDNLKDYVLPPQCTTVARCYQVVDIGLQETKFGYKNQVVIGWELPNQRMEDGKAFTISYPYNQSWGTGGRLRQHLEAWRGKKFASHELDVFDLRSLIGKPCLISICHDTNSNGQTWATVAAVGACPAELLCPPAINPPLIFNLDDATEGQYQVLPDYFKNKILWPQSPKAPVLQPNMQGATTIPAPQTDQPSNVPPNQPIPTFAPAIEDATERVEFDDNVPF